MSKCRILFFVVISVVGLIYSQLGFAITECENYPHWDCSNPEQKQLITQLETLISQHQGQGGIAAFDWDGTLYDEHILNPNPDAPSGETRSGQSIWHIWGALNLSQYPFLFPWFATSGSLEQQKGDIINQDAYLEGKLLQPLDPDSSPTILNPSAYDKFSQIAKFESGMTLAQMQFGINGYLKQYKPNDYAFNRMLDIVQRFQDKGFTVWILTGSNPYYISNLFVAANGINQTVDKGFYHLFTSCDPLHALTDKCRIAGNGAKIRNDNVISGVYDDQFVKNQLPKGQVSIVDGYGKQLVLQNLQTKFPNQPILLYAGNSDGDLYAMNYTLTQGSKDSIGLFVQPKSAKFLALYNSCIKTTTGRCFDIEEPRAKH